MQVSAAGHIHTEVACIIPRKMAASSHRKPASTEIPCNSLCAQGHHKTDAQYLVYIKM